MTLKTTFAPKHCPGHASLLVVSYSLAEGREKQVKGLQQRLAGNESRAVEKDLDLTDKELPVSADPMRFQSLCLCIWPVKTNEKVTRFSNWLET